MTDFADLVGGQSAKSFNDIINQRNFLCSEEGQVCFSKIDWSALCASAQQRPLLNNEITVCLHLSLDWEQPARGRTFWQFKVLHASNRLSEVPICAEVRVEQNLVQLNSAELLMEGTLLAYVEDQLP